MEVIHLWSKLQRLDQRNESYDMNGFEITERRFPHEKSEWGELRRIAMQAAAVVGKSPVTDVRLLKAGAEMHTAFMQLFVTFKDCVDALEKMDPRHPELKEMKLFLADWSNRLFSSSAD